MLLGLHLAYLSEIHLLRPRNIYLTERNYKLPRQLPIKLKFCIKISTEPAMKKLEDFSRSSESLETEAKSGFHIKDKWTTRFLKRFMGDFPRRETHSWVRLFRFVCGDQPKLNFFFFFFNVLTF